MSKLLVFPAALVGLPLAAVVAAAWAFYVRGNGLVPGAFALGTVPVLLLAPAAPATGWKTRSLAVATAALSRPTLASCSRTPRVSCSPASTRPSSPRRARSTPR